MQEALIIELFSELQTGLRNLQKLSGHWGPLSSGNGLTGEMRGLQKHGFVRRCGQLCWGSKVTQEELHSLPTLWSSAYSAFTFTVRSTKVTCRATFGIGVKAEKGRQWTQTGKVQLTLPFGKACFLFLLSSFLVNSNCQLDTTLELPGKRVLGTRSGWLARRGLSWLLTDVKDPASCWLYHSIP